MMTALAPLSVCPLASKSAGLAECLRNFTDRGRIRQNVHDFTKEMHVARTDENMRLADGLALRYREYELDD